MNDEDEGIEVEGMDGDEIGGGRIIFFLRSSSTFHNSRSNQYQKNSVA